MLIEQKATGEAARAIDAAASAVVANRAGAEAMEVVGRYRMECRDADGNIKWAEEFDNLVVNVGKADMLDKYLAGSAYTAAFYLGLVDGGSAPTFNAADTMASHAGWTENTGYSAGTRPAPTWNSATASGGGAGSAGTGSKATTATSFSINASGTIAGCFLTTNSAKSGTTGTLFSAGAFTGGNRTVASGDTLNCTYTAQN